MIPLPGNLPRLTDGFALMLLLLHTAIHEGHKETPGENVS
jgi:hypothetical protein